MGLDCTVQLFSQGHFGGPVRAFGYGRKPGQIVSAGNGKIDQLQTRLCQRIDKPGNVKRPVLTVQQKVKKPRIVGLVVTKMRIATKRVARRDVRKNSLGRRKFFGWLQIAIKPVEGLLQRVDSGPAIGCVDHKAKAPTRRDKAFCLRWIKEAAKPATGSGRSGL